MAQFYICLGNKLSVMLASPTKLEQKPYLQTFCVFFNSFFICSQTICPICKSKHVITILKLLNGSLSSLLWNIYLLWAFKFPESYDLCLHVHPNSHHALSYKCLCSSFPKIYSSLIYRSLHMLVTPLGKQIFLLFLDSSYSLCKIAALAGTPSPTSGTG